MTVARSSRWVVAGTALVLLTTVAPLPALESSSAADEAPLDRARHAAEQVPFLGVVQVSWRDGEVVRHQQLNVHAANGAVEVDGGAGSVIESPDHVRMATGQDHEWAVLWSPAGGLATAPPLSRKYSTTTLAAHPRVAGRSTTVSELRDGASVRERLYVDDETGLLVRREQYGATGALERTVEFLVLAVDESTPAPVIPVHTAVDIPRRLSASRPHGASGAPPELEDGYVRLDAFRRGATLHFLYSDGLYNLSLFEEPGRLDVGGLPTNGRRVRIGGDTGVLFTWAGGHVLVWDAGHRVLTMVSDAPSDHLVQAAQSVSAWRTSGPSLLDKLHRVCDALVDPLR
jgi:sigma-E factor negative regulatory protein RseB